MSGNEATAESVVTCLLVLKSEDVCSSFNPRADIIERQFVLRGTVEQLKRATDALKVMERERKELKIYENSSFKQVLPIVRREGVKIYAVRSFLDGVGNNAYSGRVWRLK